MLYTDRFKNIDDFLKHLDPLMNKIDDPLIQSRYLGFITTFAVTGYELAIKDIFFEFSDKKHKVLGAFVRAQFERMNGRIRKENLRDDISKFGEEYRKKFDEYLESKDNQLLHLGRGSPISSYGNIIAWRHQFVHGGAMSNTTYVELKKSYNLGKEVIHCLDGAMRG